MLHHLTIDTLDGQTVPPPSAETMEGVRKFIAKARLHGSTEVLEDAPQRLEILEEVPGAALYTITIHGNRMVTCAAYWTLDGKSSALKWQFADRDQPGPSIAIGDYLPGLFTRLEVGITLDHEAATWLADCTQCIAWTLAREGAQ